MKDFSRKISERVEAKRSAIESTFKTCCFAKIFT